jgi:chorismate-pyruvate lyase
VKHSVCPASSLEASQPQDVLGGTMLFGRMLFSQVQR